MANTTKMASRAAQGQKQAENKKHKWRVGELCTAIYDSIGEGIIYRVTAVINRTTNTTYFVGPTLKLTPVYGVISDISRRKPRNLDAGYCTPMSIVDLATFYMKLGMFISEEAKHRGTDEETTTETLSPGNDGADEERLEAGDGRVLLDSSSGEERGGA